MDVILLDDVEKLGLRGEVVGVARGYARNFLLPRKLAEVATPAKVAELERREAKRLRHEAATVDQANEIADRLRAAELRFDVSAGPTGTLFGSVTSTDVADELWNALKIRVDRRKIRLHDPIKRIGRYQVPIELFGDIVVEVHTLVVPEGGELPPEEPEPAEGEAVEAEADAQPEAEVEAEVEVEVETVQPEAEAPVAEVSPEPAEPAPDEPVEPMPDEPVEPAPDEPAEPAPDEPAPSPAEPEPEPAEPEPDPET